MVEGGKRDFFFGRGRGFGCRRSTLRSERFAWDWR